MRAYPAQPVDEGGHQVKAVVLSLPLRPAQQQLVPLRVRPDPLHRADSSVPPINAVLVGSWLGVPSRLLSLQCCSKSKTFTFRWASLTHKPSFRELGAHPTAAARPLCSPVVCLLLAPHRVPPTSSSILVAAPASQPQHRPQAPLPPRAHRPAAILPGQTALCKVCSQSLTVHVMILTACYAKQLLASILSTKIPCLVLRRLLSHSCRVVQAVHDALLRTCGAGAGAHTRQASRQLVCIQPGFLWHSPSLAHSGHRSCTRRPTASVRTTPLHAPQNAPTFP